MSILCGLPQGYKMIGNAVPVKLAYHVAKSILETLQRHGIQLIP